LTGYQSFLRSFFVFAGRIFTFLACFTMLGSVLRAQVSFRKPDFDTGKGPVSVSAADFNRDGLLDIVTANSTDNSITVLLNNGSGAFTGRKDYPAGKNPRVVLTGDFNNDGVADAAVANQDDNTVSIFLGNGDGSLRAFATIAVAAQPDAMVAGDFNRDGKLDLAVLSHGANSVGIYLGNGNGSFSHTADYVAGANSNALSFDSVVAADFNGDGVLDLAVTNGSDGVSIFLGNGDGGFHSGGSFSVLNGAAGEVGPLVAADFNQDGKTDLAVQFLPSCRGCEPDVSIYAGHGDGTFDQGHSAGIFPEFGAPMLAVDLNGDHVPDLVVPPMIVFTNPATVFTNGAPAKFKVMPPTGLEVRGLVAGDFNGDGKLDIVTANLGDDTVSVLINNGDGTLHQPLRYLFPTPSPDRIVSADFDGDGIPDLAVKDTSHPGILLYFDNGDGTFKAPVEISTDLQAYQLATADVNGDGIPDLVVQGILLPSHGQTRVLRVLLGKGDGSFRAPIDSSGAGSTLEGIRIADFNGDGIPDVALLAPDFSNNARSDVLAISLGNGDGSFRTPVNTPIGSASNGLAVGDFDRDGKMDAVVGFSNISTNGESFIIYSGNGDGTFRAGKSHAAPGGVSSVATADVNRDGLLDLIVGHGHSVAVFLGNGDGTFRQSADMAAYQGPYQVQAADINGDGMPDIVVANTRISTFLGNGDGSFQPRQDFGIGGAIAAAIGDFNSDGLADIAVANGFMNGSVSLMLSGSGPQAARDFRFSLSATSVTLRAGQSATLTAFVAAIGAFKDPVTFSCAGLPAGAACSLNPPMVTPGTNGPLSSTLTITTQARNSAAVSSPPRGLFAFAFGLPILGIALTGIRVRRGVRSQGRVRLPESWKLAIVLALLVAALLMLQGCAGTASHSAGNGVPGSGSSAGGAGTPPGTYTVTVAATSSASPVISHSQTITLNVQ